MSPLLNALESRAKIARTNVYLFAWSILLARVGSPPAIARCSFRPSEIMAEQFVIVFNSRDGPNRYDCETFKGSSQSLRKRYLG